MTGVLASATGSNEAATLTMRRAVTEALHEIMSADPDAIMLGEVLDSRGGAAMITYGFADRYGPGRAIETPISENALVGMALGAAVAGLTVVAEVYSADFLFCAGSEVINDIAKWRYQHQLKSPLRLVLRMPAGSSGSWSGPEHTQSIEALLNNVPGLRIVAPSSGPVAKQALIEAVNTGDPVVFLEHRSLYDVAAPADADLGVAGSSVLDGRVTRRGADLTIVAWGAMHRVASDAAEELERMGIASDVIDPVSVKPLPLGLILESVQRTKRLLVVDEGPRTGSVSADVVVRVMEELGVGLAFERVNLPDVHHPFDPRLEARLLPSAAAVTEAAARLVGTGKAVV